MRFQPPWPETWLRKGHAKTLRTQTCWEAGRAGGSVIPGTPKAEPVIQPCCTRGSNRWVSPGLLDSGFALRAPRNDGADVTEPAPHRAPDVSASHADGVCHPIRSSIFDGDRTLALEIGRPYARRVARVCVRNSQQPYAWIVHGGFAS
jgi:hypothetical protein